ncbi:hypothetical protein [Nocardiopsis ansamitocini]|uniref:Uncharacterized protein n=1 Tax=Nocardiopsis ansamitocini TaxID=1670832 RepID=A0A9W6UH90_9ACTN|nr:hypothetical protein [Nocardiopsis ansamitocini]GLU45725.1 hypothetical protein Nans01_00760 [Nocardiopsis ansamitocini]
MAQQNPPLQLPLPERLPRHRAEMSGALRTVTDLCPIGMTAQERRATRARLGSAVDAAPTKATGRREREAAAYDVHFGVERVGGDPGRVFLVGLFTAYCDLLDDVEACGSRLRAQRWRALLDGSTAVVGFAARTAPVTTVPTGPPPPPPVAPDGPAVLRRWHVGHRLFFVLVQALTVALSCLRSARGDGTGMRDALELAIVLNRASAASMHYAGDFSAAGYAEVVRPSMEPPFTAPGFSGLQGRDHRYLIRQFGGLHAVAAEIPGGADVYRRFTASVTDLHRAHSRVCARFGGDALPTSLRMRGDRPEQEGARSVEVLAVFAERRLSLLSRATGPDPSGR